MLDFENLEFVRKEKKKSHWFKQPIVLDIYELTCSECGGLSKAIYNATDESWMEGVLFYKEGAYCSKKCKKLNISFSKGKAGNTSAAFNTCIDCGNLFPVGDKYSDFRAKKCSDCRDTAELKVKKEVITALNNAATVQAEAENDRKIGVFLKKTKSVSGGVPNGGKRK